ncbi:MAG: DNRLRE domain-containing protein, partial [Caldilinea sp.]
MKHLLLRLAGVFALVCVVALLLTRGVFAQVDGAVAPATGHTADLTTRTFRPIQDTYVDSATADASFARADVLRINLGATAFRQRTYLRFDLAAVPPGAAIQSAELDLYQTVGSAGSILVYGVASDWDATKTTWNNQPDVGSFESWNAPATTNQYISFTSRIFTSLVQDWVSQPTRNFGLMLDTGAVTGDGREFHSAENSSGQTPRLSITFALPRIRVCDDVNCLKPAANAEVHDLRGVGAAYTTDANGYVQDDGAIQLGDALWARTVVETTPRGVRYMTSGAPQPVNAAAFVLYPGWNQPEMRLVLQRPLYVRDLVASAQWSLNDADRAALTQRFEDASDHLYRFTDGQFALGDVVVYQNYREWNNAATDLWLYSSNAMRPLSYIKGEVTAPTPDPASGVDFVYDPGHIYMGSQWNRYGLPPTQPLSPGVDVSRDWAAALAHELGHYLLGQFDSYIAVLPSGVVNETFACTGSAMGWVYEASNQAFVWNAAHWDAACGATLGAFNVKRTEWQTIQTWHPWVQTPQTMMPFTGTPPIGLVNVTFITDPLDPPPLVGQTFDLAYQENESASAEARAFLLRDVDGDGVADRILDQGRPPQNVVPPVVTLTGALADDRLCVIDINDYAELPDSPRHQFGCERIEAGDASLTMRRDPAWAPVIEITPISPTEVGIFVRQVLEGATVRARLYPEHDATPTAILPLTPGEDGWAGVFTVSGLTPAAFVQVWV